MDLGPFVVDLGPFGARLHFPPPGPHFWGERGGIWAHFGVSPPPPVPQTPAPGSEAAPSGAAESR